MKLKSTIPVMVSSAVLLAACGGGGGNTSTNPTASSSVFKITGTVPGTLIEAFCEDGSYYKVNSETNATDQHPYSLSLPADLSCRLVMTTNENDPDKKVITAIRLVNNQSTGSIAFSLDGDADLGHINLAMARDEMVSDSNQDGVEDIPRETILDDQSSTSIVVINTSNDPLDKDNDGIINLYEDDDGDKINNNDDLDDDNDGIPDLEDNDHDNDGHSDNDLDSDGITNDRDTDDDNDGQSDGVDTDDDNDGISDADDSDDDNDGIDDSIDEDEINDLDDDGVQNGFDADDDNDGIDDISDNDDDNDGIEDKDDNDDDNDGINDSQDEDYNEDDSNTPIIPVTPSTPTGSTPTAGRLLAAQCAQCHGTDGVSTTGIDSLAGESRQEIIEEMLEMQAEGKQEIMHLQAKGYSSEQVGYIADYFSGLSGQQGGED